MDEKRPRVGSATIVIHENKILLGRRNKKNAFGKWIIPGGGVDWGESLEQAAIREIKEETNLNIIIDRFIGFKEIIAIEHDYHALVFFHLGHPKNPNELSASEDVSEVNFFSIEEIKKLDILSSVKWALKKAKLWN